MRIIGGELRGRRLNQPKNRAIRPTSDRVREAVFNVLGAQVREAEVLDLFAGTGALGLEALSRGAARVVFVDQSADAVRLIRSNVERCGLWSRAEIIRGPIPRIIARLVQTKRKFDLIFMDPPYGKGHVVRVLPLLVELTLPGSRVIVEHRARNQLVLTGSQWLCEDARKYGDTMVSFLSLRRDQEIRIQ